MNRKFFILPATVIVAFAAGWWLRGSRIEAPTAPRVEQPGLPASREPELVPLAATEGTATAPARVEIDPGRGVESGDEDAYEVALRRATLPEPTGDADTDRRNALRHIIRYASPYDSPDYDGPRVDAENVISRDDVNPRHKHLTPEQLKDLQAVLDDAREAAHRTWQERLTLEREAMLRAVDTGSFEWYGPDARHHDPTLSVSEQKSAFQKRMNETWGPMGKEWTCLLTGARGEDLVPYVTRRSAPELFAAIDRCFVAEREALDRARRFVEQIP